MRLHDSFETIRAFLYNYEEEIIFLFNTQTVADSKDPRPWRQVGEYPFQQDKTHQSQHRVNPSVSRTSDTWNEASEKLTQNLKT